MANVRFTANSFKRVAATHSGLAAFNLAAVNLFNRVAPNAFYRGSVSGESKFSDDKFVKKHSEFAGGEFVNADKKFDGEENEDEKFFMEFLRKRAHEIEEFNLLKKQSDAYQKLAAEKLEEFLKKQPEGIEEFLKKQNDEKLAEFLKNEKFAGSENGFFICTCTTKTETELQVKNALFSFLLSKAKNVLTRLGLGRGSSAPETGG